MPEQQSDGDANHTEADHHEPRGAESRHIFAIAAAAKSPAEPDVRAVGNQAQAGEEAPEIRHAPARDREDAANHEWYQHSPQRPAPDHEQLMWVGMHDRLRESAQRHR